MRGRARRTGDQGWTGATSSSVAASDATGPSIRATRPVTTTSGISARFPPSPRTVLAAASSNADHPSAYAGSSHDAARSISAQRPAGEQRPLAQRGPSRYASSPSSAPLARTPSAPTIRRRHRRSGPTRPPRRGERAAELDQHERRLVTANPHPRRLVDDRVGDRAHLVGGAEVDPVVLAVARHRRQVDHARAEHERQAAAGQVRISVRIPAIPTPAPRSSGRTSTICARDSSSSRPPRPAARRSRWGHRSGRTARGGRARRAATGIVSQRAALEHPLEDRLPVFQHAQVERDRSRVKARYPGHTIVL